MRALRMTDVCGKWKHYFEEKRELSSSRRFFFRIITLSLKILPGDKARDIRQHRNDEAEGGQTAAR